MKKINIGIVGCGRISNKHIESILHNDDKFNLISVCDSDEKKLTNVNVKSNVVKYLSLEEMLKNEKLDVVSICTPSGYHSEHATLISSYNINVLTEKPMATNYNDALNMIEACKVNNVKLYVVKQNRYNQTLIELKNAINQNRFGKIKMISINVFWNRDQEYYDQDSWRGTWKLDGGALMNQASHYVDLLTWLNGPIKSVNAMSSTSLKIEAEDSIVLNVKFNDSAIGSMSVSMLAFKKNFEGSITVLGEKGLVKIGGVAVNKIDYWEFSKKELIDEKIMSASYEVDSIYGKGHFKYYSELAKSINNEYSSISDGQEGIKSLETIIAAYKSAKENKTIYLPLVI